MTFDIKNGVLLKVHDCDAHVVIPSYITTIGKYAFANCSSLQSVFIPPSVTHILDYAFSSCHTLKSVSIPTSVTAVGSGVFRNCSALQFIDLAPDDPHFSFKNGFFSKDGTLLFVSPALTDVVIPNFINEIENFAFVCPASLHSLFISPSVTSIAGAAFFDCSFPHSVTLSEHHFSTTGIINLLNKVQIILTYMPPEEIPDDYYPKIHQHKACFGFLLNREKYPRELHAPYLDYIRTHAEKMSWTLWTDHKLLRKMYHEDLLPADMLPFLLEEAIEDEHAELFTLLLHRMCLKKAMSAEMFFTVFNKVLDLEKAELISILLDCKARFLSDANDDLQLD